MSGSASGGVSPSGGIFREPVKTERGFPVAAVVVAAVLVLLAAGVYAALSRRQALATGRSQTLGQTAAYGPNLRLGDVQLSESTTLSGGKETYVDGKITNAGPKTVTGATVQVLFAPESGGSPQMETAPVTLIRMRQPYIDTEPLSAAPLAPGATAEFRLIFEDVRPEWNEQPPEIHVTGVSTR